MISNNQNAVPTPCIPSHSPGGIFELMAIALPMLVSQGCETMMMFIDRLFLSRLGPEHMSAALGGGLTCFMFTTFFIGLTGYTTALVAQYLGARQSHNCSKVVTQSLLFAIIAYPVVLLCVPLGHLLFRLTGIAPAQLIQQQAYFDILMFGTIIGLLRNVFSCFFSGIGRTRVVMLGAGIAMVVNVALNYALIFGEFGFPAMGIRGAAIGTIGGSLAGLVFVAFCYFGRRYQREYDVLAGLRYNGTIMRKLLRLGSPAGVELFLNILAFNLLILNFHSYGINVAAAVTITFNWDMVTFIPLVGVGIGVTSLVGRYMGAGEPDVAHRATMSGLKFAAAYSAIAFVAFTLFPQPLVGLFHPAADDNAAFVEIMQLATFMVRLISVYIFVDAVVIVFSSALRGAGDTFWTMCISVSSHWFLTLSAMVMIHYAHFTPRVTWLLMVLIILALGVPMYLRYHSGRWREMQVVGV